jgi:hypothetical protein
MMRDGKNIVLILDTGAAQHLFEFLPETAYNVKNEEYEVLLAGRKNHKVDTSYVFDVGKLKGVLLLPTTMKIGYNIVSLGQLNKLRITQVTDDLFYVV